MCDGRQPGSVSDYLCKPSGGTTKTGRGCQVIQHVHQHLCVCDHRALPVHDGGLCHLHHLPEWEADQAGGEGKGDPQQPQHQPQQLQPGCNWPDYKEEDYGENTRQFR